jgi:hypothetical protein
MKRITIRLVVAFLTFLIGVAVSAVWILRSPSPIILEEPPCRSNTENASPLPPRITTSLEWQHVPALLQERLALRVYLFTKCQQTREWEDVAELLGDLDLERNAYTPEQKSDIIRLMKENPLMHFTPQSLLSNSEIIDEPIEQKLWAIMGEADYEDGTNQDVLIMAYLRNGEWYFTPDKVNLGRPRE